jgi:hypothetical protein
MTIRQFNERCKLKASMTVDRSLFAARWTMHGRDGDALTGIDVLAGKAAQIESTRSLCAAPA